MTSESFLPAESCASMADVRAAIDHVDTKIVTLLAERMRYIEAAARIKQDRDAVRDEARKAEVIAHACRVARGNGFPELLARQIYETLVEGSIRYELERFDKR
jgi:isochorismate pyruvate lyase